VYYDTAICTHSSPFKAYRLLHAPQDLAFKNCAFCPHLHLSQNKQRCLPYIT